MVQIFNMKNLVLLILINISYYTEAAILVLNFNQNDSSINAIKEAASIRNEELLIFPFSNRHPESKISRSIPKINKDTIKEIFSITNNYVEKKQTTITNIVFSGHAGSGGFSGKDGSIRREDIISAIEGFQEIRTSVKSLLLRGCYTTTLAEVMPNQSWRTMFPNLSVISGYEGKAWSSEKLASKTFVKEALLLENNFIFARSPEEVVNIYKKFSHYQISETAIWVKHQSISESKNMESFITTQRVFNGKVPIELTHIAKQCKSNKSIAYGYQKEVQKYFEGDVTGYLRPLKNTQTSKNKLRKIYSFINKKQHCIKYKFWDKRNIEKDLSPNNIMPLLFFNKITANFSRAYNVAEFIDLINWANQRQELAKKDFPFLEALIFPNITAKDVNDTFITGEKPPFGTLVKIVKHSSRGFLRDFELKLGDFINNSHNLIVISNHEHKIKLARIKYFHKAFKELLIDFSPLYLPHSWMTEKVFYQPALLSPGSTLQQFPHL